MLILFSTPPQKPVASPDFLDCKVELDVNGKKDSCLLISNGFQEIITKLIMSL